jgi:hypothetical protein
MSRERSTGTALPRKRQREERRQALHRRVAPRWSEWAYGVERGTWELPPPGLGFDCRVE